MDFKSKIILISGPTASGKSHFAIKFAKKINGEIINADSMQVYKQLRILSARPNPKDYQKIKHHLYGFHDVKKNFSTGDWLKLTIKKIKEIKKRKKTPILVGGTGLYFKSLIDGLVKIPNIPIRVRNKIRKLHKDLGQKKFYQKLIKLDSSYKKNINPTDAQRSIRAYEVKSYTKISLYKWFGKTVKSFKDDEFIKIYIDFPRADLVKKISLRVDDMFKKGAIQEVKDYFKIKVRKDKSSNKVIGLIEIQKYLTNQESLETVKDLILVKSRQYAKRQITWARGHMSTWKKIDPSDLVSFLKKI